VLKPIRVECVIFVDILYDAAASCHQMDHKLVRSLACMWSGRVFHSFEHCITSSPSIARSFSGVVNSHMNSIAGVGWYQSTNQMIGHALRLLFPSCSLVRTTAFSLSTYFCKSDAMRRTLRDCGAEYCQQHQHQQPRPTTVRMFPTRRAGVARASRTNDGRHGKGVIDVIPGRQPNRKLWLFCYLGS